MKNNNQRLKAGIERMKQNKHLILIPVLYVALMVLVMLMLKNLLQEMGSPYSGNVTQKTMQHEVACLNKLSLCVNKKFGINTDFTTGRIVPVMELKRKRDVVFTKEQIKGLKEYFATKKDCYSKTACGQRQWRYTEVVIIC